MMIKFTQFNHLRHSENLPKAPPNWEEARKTQGGKNLWYRTGVQEGNL